MKESGKIGLDLRFADVMWKDWLSRGLNGYLEQYFKLTGRKVLVCMGQPLLSPDGRRRVLYFCRVGGESPRWYWVCGRLGDLWNAGESPEWRLCFSRLGLQWFADCPLVALAS